MNQALLSLRHQLGEVVPGWVVTSLLGPTGRYPLLFFMAHWALLGLLYRVVIDPWFSPATVQAGVASGLVIGFVLLLAGCGGPRRPH